MKVDMMVIMMTTTMMMMMNAIHACHCSDGNIMTEGIWYVMIMTGSDGNHGRWHMMTTMMMMVMIMMACDEDDCDDMMVCDDDRLSNVDGSFMR